MLKIEPFELYSVVTGSLRLDGGAMFGVVPKVLWGNATDVDDLNRIPLATRTLLAVDRGRSRVILVDTGCGTKWNPKAAQRYAVTHDPEAIPNALRRTGLTVEQVTDVIVTHAHFDHNGGLTFWRNEPGGELRLHYPQARHWIHRRHWEHAHHPFVKDRASFLLEDFHPLEKAGVLHFVEGEAPESPFEGVEWFISHGHTPYLLHPVLGTGEQRLMFVSDLVPTVNHLRLTWVMAYDVEPLRTIEEKESIYKLCLKNEVLIAFPHDPRVGGVAIVGEIERPIVSRVLEL